MKTLLSTIFNTDLPVLQAPMALAVSPEFAARVSNCGAIGGFGAYCLSPVEMHNAINTIRERTTKPFNINLFVPPHIKNDMFANPKEAVARFDAQLDYLLESPVPILSFHFGLAAEQMIERLKRSGTTIVSTATSYDEARYLEQKGVEIIVLQGKEAGGHHNKFLAASPDFIPLEKLFAECLQTIDAPLVAAGGITTANDIAKYLDLGASGVQMGTAFLVCQESSIDSDYRQSLAHAKSDDTYITDQLTGHAARTIKTETGKHFWCGQGIEKVAHKSIEELTSELKKHQFKGNNYE